MKFFVSVLFLLVHLTGNAQETVLHGKVTADGMPVAYASIKIDSRELLTNIDGEFAITGLSAGTLQLTITAQGFLKSEKKVDLSPNQPNYKEFILETSREFLQEVFIVDKQTGLTRKTPYTISSISLTGIENKGNPGGIMGTLQEIPGIYGAAFGQGIVKPLIRGLGFSRIVTIYQGNKLENHQWGADHGLGLNDLGIKRVDVIKGPASILYGSGALGGVLLSRDDESYTTGNSLTGTAGFTYNSTSNGLRSYATLGGSFDNNLFFSIEMALESHSDYLDGNSRIIGNSRFNNQTIRLHTGVEKETYQNKLSLTYNNQNLGIIDDEEMLEGRSLATERNDRKMQLPFQTVKDYLLSYEQSSKHNALETYFHLSHHFNERREIEEDINIVDLGLLQNHTFYNARITYSTDKLEHNLGAQGSFLITRNIKESRDFLIPDAQMFESGLYYLSSLDLGSWYLQGALRYDFRRLTAKAQGQHFIDYNFILPGNPENRKLNRYFSGITGSLGATKKINDQHLLKFNISSGYRAPDLAELFSNGPHPGTNRFEQGNANFGLEQSLQGDVNYTFQKGRFTAGVSGFMSQINNYIYFAGTNLNSPLGNLEVWAYQQTNASFYGGEFEVKHTWLPQNRLTTKLTGALVRAKDLIENSSLTFIPPDNYSAQLNYFALQDKSLSLFTNLRLVGDQYRIGRNEERTAGYTLLSGGLSKKFYLGKNLLESGITVHNALNKNYIDHLSILRAFNVGSPGRNIMLNLRYTH